MAKKPSNPKGKPIPGMKPAKAPKAKRPKCGK
jgi:hypothetical protein